MALSKKSKIEKALLESIIENMVQQKGYMFSKDEIISWLNAWNNYIE